MAETRANNRTQSEIERDRATAISQQENQNRNKSQDQRRGLSRRNESGYFSPFALFDRIADEMFGRMFRDLGSSRAGASQRSLINAPAAPFAFAEAWIPRVETFQKDDRFVVRAELPGMSKDDVRVEVTEDAIVLEGERREEHEEQREGFREIAYGRFYREVPLSPGVIADTAQATFRNGVLEITMQAAPDEANRGRRLEIKEGSEAERT
jgi:HSP20 family protein